MLDKKETKLLLKSLGYIKYFNTFKKWYEPDNKENKIKIVQQLKVDRYTKSVLASVKSKSIVYSHYNIKDIAIALNRTVSDAKHITKILRRKNNESVSSESSKS